MRIGFLADSHFASGKGLQECRQVHDFIASDMAEREVDLVIHGGDVFDARPSKRDSIAVADLFDRLASRCPVFVVRGNHDTPAGLEVLRSLCTVHQIVVEPAVGLHKVWTRKGHAWVLGIAWNQTVPRGSNFIVPPPRSGAPFILAGHLLVRGAQMSSGQIASMPEDMIRKGYRETSIESLRRTGADIVLLGHIHARQQWEDGTLVAYAGSPMRLHPSEIEPKCYIVADVRPGRPVEWARVDVAVGG
jgi:DNA repair exonuclease SbcCD nuclease subunit